MIFIKWNVFITDVASAAEPETEVKVSIIMTSIIIAAFKIVRYGRAYVVNDITTNESIMTGQKR